MPLKANVPEAICVPPVYPFVPAKVSVPVPDISKIEPVPPPRPPSVITPKKVVFVGPLDISVLLPALIVPVPAIGPILKVDEVI